VGFKIRCRHACPSFCSSRGDVFWYLCHTGLSYSGR
jgi:hypothetical protein